jgi:dsRNA-specific ribonuclease
MLTEMIDTEWPEGYLSFAKDKLVANSRLSRAALETGLSRFILTKPFTGQKWRPLYLVNALNPREEQNARRLSTKTLADVVEALIGASYADGGLSKALQCISVFITEPSWRDTSVGRDMMLRAARKDDRNLGVVAPVQEMIGYEFKTTSLLLEALTHGSYIADSEVRSLERLEFLGDAVLDYIIVTRLYEATPKLTHSQMHMLKTALVNGEFLAFVALERRHNDVQEMDTTDGEVEEQLVQKPLWMFMRHTSPAIVEEQKSTVKRHERMRDEVNDAIAHGTHYPWALLARLQMKKFYSDLIEALLGAVWIDSGSIEQCEIMLTHLGILPYLERILRDNVHVQHPKEELTRAAVSEKIKYVIDVREGEDGEKEWLCKIHLGERIIASVEGGVNKEEVKTKAAAEALTFLNAERGVAI